MSTEKTYNGWTNYETWNVKLWIDNDEGSQNYWSEQADNALEQARPDNFFTKEERATLDLSDTLKSEYEDAMHDLLDNAKASASVWADLLGAAMSEINWHEIAESLLETAKERVEA